MQPQRRRMLLLSMLSLLTRFVIWLPSLLLPLNHSEAINEPTQILETTLSAPCLSDFWQRDSSGRIQLAGIWANNQMPAGQSIHLQGSTLPILPGKTGQTPHHLVVERFRLRGARAHLVIKGYNGLRIKARLIWAEKQWTLQRIFVRQKIRTAAGKQGSHYCYDF